MDGWKANFSARELREIDAWRRHAREFGHVSGGVNPQLIAAKMADLLDLADREHGGEPGAEEEQPSKRTHRRKRQEAIRDGEREA